MILIADYDLATVKNISQMCVAPPEMTTSKFNFLRRTVVHLNNIALVNLPPFLIEKMRAEFTVFPLYKKAWRTGLLDLFRPPLL